MAATITVICPQCKNRMRASSESAGRQGRCPSCKELLEIRAVDEQITNTIHPTQTASLPREVDPRLSSTDISGWQSGVIGTGITGVLYLVVFALWKTTGHGQLIVDRGAMPFFILLLTIWGLTMLVMKYRAVRRQIGFAEKELELIPLEVGLQITPSNVEQFLGHLAGRPRAERLSIVGRRIDGALEHFKSRQSVPEVQEYLATQAEIDASGVDAGYTLLRAFIWAVPILGFIGTVMGISFAVAGLQVSGGGGQELMDGLQQVTGGLSTAFDTTLIALLMAILLLFPTESLRKSEYAMLDRIESFANESLLRRMSDQRDPAADGEMPEIVRRSLEAAFREHQKWLAQWQAQVGKLGQHIGSDLEAAAGRVVKQINYSEEAQLEKYQSVVNLLEQIFDKAEQRTSAWEKIGREASGISAELVEATNSLGRSLAENADQAAKILDKQQKTWQSYADGGLDELARQIARLADKLAGSEPTMTLPMPDSASSVDPKTDFPPGHQAQDPSTRTSGIIRRFFGRQR